MRRGLFIACLEPILLCSQLRAQDASPDLHSKTAEVMRHSTVHSTIGPIETPLPIELCDFFLDHPDISASLVRGRRLAPYRITMVSPLKSLADDGDGTKGLITLVEKTGGARLYYGEGTHESRVFPTIRAAATIALNVETVQKAGCPPHVRSSIRVHVRLRNPVLATMVKALRPFLKNLIIRKFSKAFLVAHQVGILVAKDPGVFSEIRASKELPEKDRPLLEKLAANFKPDPAECL